MPIKSPTGRETRSELADWVELSTIVSPSGSSGAAELRALVRREEDSERRVLTDELTGDQLEEETLDTEEDRIEDAVLSEIEFRKAVLGLDYPFTVETSRGSWALSFDGLGSSGSEIYLSCLLISCMRDKRIREDAVRAESGVDPARLFQAISSDASQALLGRSISFGWPRADGTNFRDALQGFVDALRVGKPKSQPPFGASRAVKDEGIDVIAWRSFTDGRPGNLLLFGQVASGGNWRGKPVAVELPLFLDWFHTRPAQHPITAMFIPFPQHHDFEPSADVSWDDGVVDFCRRNEMVFGLMFDRLRLTELSAGPPPADATPWITAGISVARAPA